MNTIGSRIREIRERQGIQRGALAKAVGLAYSSLSDLESGKAKSTTVLHKIASRLGVNVEWLETGKGSSEPASQSQEMRLNREILAKVARALHKVYDAEELAYDFTVEYELFAELYEDAVNGRINRGEGTVKIGRWIERHTDRGLDGRRDGLPAPRDDQAEKGVQGETEAGTGSR